ncbi:glycosyltransferase family 2 protein [Faunimonas pinastri]|uniref:glycosyltransferase family 2 protein n=1 Tax=Faunimonas pinastri TaxID=1855383 RepID=UPI0015A6DFBE|nr:glycosyltransferase family 2 protein [Faunimonas pinastri]
MSQAGSGAAAKNPLRHYLHQGWLQGLRPNPGFDPLWYLRANPDVRVLGCEPLTHYATRGRREMREPGPRGSDPAGGEFPPVLPQVEPTEPREDEWDALIPREHAAEPRVDVIIPVYAGRTEALRSIQRALAARNLCPAEIVVIDDASPDPALAMRLRHLADRGLITLLRNEGNLGFVGSVNRGIRLHPGRDVVLLNADTEVFGNWLDRLRNAALSHAGIGTVTPLSSDATILSYPIRLRNNSMPLELGDRELDELAAGLAPELVEIPTGVGFCLYIRRACLDAVGPFDAERFGRGYGEENDFCRRALKAGWRSMAAPHVYVRHYGGRSFRQEKQERIEAALRTMRQLHPDYGRVVARFIRDDPLAPCRERLDEARVRRAVPSAVLTLGRTSRATEEPFPGLWLLPDVGPSLGRFRLEADVVPVAPNLAPVDLRAPVEVVAERLRRLGVAEVRIAEGWTDGRRAARLLSAAAFAGIPASRNGPVQT